MDAKTFTDKHHLNDQAIIALQSAVTTFRNRWATLAAPLAFENADIAASQAILDGGYDMVHAVLDATKETLDAFIAEIAAERAAAEGGGEDTTGGGGEDTTIGGFGRDLPPGSTVSVTTPA